MASTTAPGAVVPASQYPAYSPANYTADLTTISVIYNPSMDVADLKKQLAGLPGFRWISFDQKGACRVRFDSYSNACAALETITAYMNMGASLANANHIQPPRRPTWVRATRILEIKAPTWIEYIQLKKLMNEYEGIVGIWECEPRQSTVVLFSNQDSATRRGVHSRTGQKQTFEETHGLDPSAPEFHPEGQGWAPRSPRALIAPAPSNFNSQYPTVRMPNIDEVIRLAKEFIRSTTSVFLHHPKGANCIHVSNAPQEILRVLFAGLQGFENISQSSGNVYIRFSASETTSAALVTLKNLLTLGKLGIGGSVKSSNDADEGEHGEGMVLDVSQTLDGQESKIVEEPAASDIPEKGKKGWSWPRRPDMEVKTLEKMPQGRASSAPPEARSPSPSGKQGKSVGELRQTRASSASPSKLEAIPSEENTLPATEKLKMGVPVNYPTFDASKGPGYNIWPESIKPKTESIQPLEIVEGDETDWLLQKTFDTYMMTRAMEVAALREKKMAELTNHYMLKIQSKDKELRDKDTIVADLTAKLEAIKTAGTNPQEQLQADLQKVKDEKEALRKDYERQIQQLNVKSKAQKAEKSKLEAAEREHLLHIKQLTADNSKFESLINERDASIADLKDASKDLLVLQMELATTQKQQAIDERDRAQAPPCSTSELDKMTSDLAAKTLELEQLFKKNNELSELNNRRLREIQDLNAKHQHEMQNLKIQHQKASADTGELQREKDRIAAESKAHQGTVSRLKGDIKQRESEMREMNKENTRQKKIVENQEEDLKQAHIKYEQLRAENVALMADKDRLNEASETTQEIVVALQAANDEKDRQIKELKGMVEEGTGDVERVKAELKGAKEREEEREKADADEIRLLRAEVDEKVAEIKGLKGEAAMVERMEQELEGAVMSMKEAESALKEAIAERDDLSGDLAGAQERIRELEGVVAEMEKKMVALTEKYKKENGELRADVERVEREREAMRVRGEERERRSRADVLEEMVGEFEKAVGWCFGEECGEEEVGRVVGEVFECRKVVEKWVGGGAGAPLVLVC
ncbi:hypothetical protein HDV00_008792 [Rhizophlyctis rosea]|nr:hypothetical protein HDV00_008792 [Rhizophlyctis rosea]